MYRTHKGWQASKKDTWSVENSLSPIILAYLKKLQSELLSSECHGVPMIYIDKQAKLEGIEDSFSEDVDIYAADKLRLADIEELIWVFGSKEPNISDYDFSIEFVEVEKESITQKHGKCFTAKVVGQEEYDRYNSDLDAYHIRKKAGYELFGRVYATLDW